MTKRFGDINHKWILAIDATENTTIEDLSMIQVGILDEKAGFVPVFLSLATHLNKQTFMRIFEFVKEHASDPPTALMADGCKATRAACQEVLPDTIVTMCFYHVLKNAKRRIGEFYIA